MSTDNETEDEQAPIYTTRRTRSAHELVRNGPSGSRRDSTDPVARSSGLRSFINLGDGLSFRSRSSTKVNYVTTTPGQRGLGETETETDEPSRHLPNTRILPASEPLVPPHLVTTILFESSRLLAVVPALLGATLNAWALYSPPGSDSEYWHYGRDARLAHHSNDGGTGGVPKCANWSRGALPDRGDYFLAVLWALLTAHQCLALTTGLLHRWRALYPPLSTLIRLLALQAICWPATHTTLQILGALGGGAPALLARLHAHAALNIMEAELLRWTTVRPAVCWAVIGSTTCFSRSIQIWVTSNLLPPAGAKPKPLLSPSKLSSSSAGAGAGAEPPSGAGRFKMKWKLKNSAHAIAGAGAPGGRRWDWAVVGQTCVLPAGCLYFVMAWVDAWRREMGSC
ncbi:hypothetical protein CONPUDRAFT_129023 [Coniophora puteana RWD-64-598 SS2]|uniref:Uncharacterized protein n=1 Tax=Coniophora puteana (strain RWD-64-598) TaxID=741705 RepID=A0A5M3MFE9_CONPW|nr:uncharacterized protein CONPUDRAFT_129023 [Coniophora puteana RWD-64-598 SS2]EIW77989.1 hypothetical protein CONPUDRAFT_129023 [Coniophora puteana RWD-64-598 SS2]